MEVTYRMAENNEEIKKWAEERGGKPAIIDDPDVVLDHTGLRIDFPGKKDESMLSEERKTTKDVSWDEFFIKMKILGLGMMISDDKDVNDTWSYRFVNLAETQSE